MNLPPLKALPVFEAVARLNSFSKAAISLNVSQSAVSHQIKLLETYLGEQLFHRTGRNLALTGEGRIYLESITSALLQIERATGQLLGQQESSLRLALFSSFGVRWLVPRLPDLHRHYPELDVSLEMTSDQPVLSERVADAFITINTDSAAFSYDLLYQERLFPVCSRQYWHDLCRRQNLDPETDVIALEVLLGCPLLSTFSIFNRTSGDWSAWLQAAGQALPEGLRIQHFSHMLLALEAARYHQGITLTNDYMMSNQADAEQFVRLPCHSLITGDSFFFAFKTSRRQEPGIRVLRRWLVAQAVASGLRGPQAVAMADSGL
ncbi:LysR family transcriptional regulator [uncultured Marinobacter sp.]|uniref:LysR family transcriptional regulator n=1 Tax=uncultured Marinobacter sp. TaxID=187379 RepID=UPI0030DA9E68